MPSHHSPHTSAENSNVHSSSNTQSSSDTAAVQYRQLVSRAATQRLHSPSLDDMPPLNDACEIWERQDRIRSRAKAQVQLKELGGTWEQFVKDIEKASQQVHVLSPTRYVAQTRGVEANCKVDGENDLHVLVGRSIMESEMENYERTQRAHIDLLNTLLRDRSRTGSD